ATGQGCAAALLDVHGKVQVTLVALALDDRVLLLTPPGMGESTVAALDHYLFAEKVTLEDAGGRRALLMLIGPAAEATVKRLTGAVPADAAWSHVGASLDGVDARVVRGGGELEPREVWDVVPPPGADVVADGAVVGRVTSATLSLGLGRPIALAFVRRQHAPGARVEVRTDRGTLPATVSDLPLSR